MLNTNIFLDKLISQGYTHFCVVPCSFAKNIINAVINNENIEYIPCASEAVACSIASGLKMGGTNPIVIVQSSGLTNMGSGITSLLKPYGIKFPIITSWRTYTYGDSEIQHQHLSTELPKLIEAYGYKYTILDSNDMDKAINQINICNTTHTITVLQKNTFSKIDLDDKHKLDLSHLIPRSQFLIQLNHLYKNSDTIFIGTTGNTSREMYSFMPNTNNFYMVGNMGGALSLGLGASLTGKKVIVLGGDAEFVMHLGGMTTTGRYTNIDLTYILFDNEQNKSTGGQHSYQNHIDYIGIAKASNIDAINQAIIKPDELKDVLGNVDNGTIKFIYIKCALDEETPRPPIDMVKRSNFDG